MPKNNDYQWCGTETETDSSGRYEHRGWAADKNKLQGLVQWQEGNVSG